VRKSIASQIGLFSILLAIGASSTATAATTILTFDELSHREEITSQYVSSGVLTSGARAFFAGIPWPAVSGDYVAFTDQGKMSFLLNSAVIGPVTSFSAYVVGTEGISISAYDANNNLIGQNAAPASTFDNSKWTNLYFQTGSASIAKVEIVGAPSNYFVDNVTFISAVPEPETYAMLLAGLGVVGFAVRRKQKHSSPFHFPVGPALAA
jgi:hypothetical protein